MLVGAALAAVASTLALLASAGGSASSLTTARALAERSALGFDRPARGDAVSARSDPACGKAVGLICTSVPVPLDSTGVVPGTVTLHVEELPA